MCNFSAKKVSSSLTLFDITQKVFHLISPLKNEHKLIFITDNLSGHSLQFNVIFIIKISVSLNRGGGGDTIFFNGATRRFIMCMLFCAGI